MSRPLPASPPNGVRGRRRHFICLGDIMVDIVARLPGPLALGSDVHAPIQTVGGGSAANTAAWLATAGAPVSLIGRISTGAMGAEVRDGLLETGVIDLIQTDPELPTGTCIVLVNPDGERTMIPDPGANAALRAEEIDRSDFTDDAHLHVSGYALIGGARPAALAALAMAREATTTISVDAASSAPLAEVGAQEFARWIGTDLLLFANVAEAEVLTGHRDPVRAVEVLAERFGFAVVKAGASGAYWSDATGEVIHRPAVQIEIVDTTGAGDAFAAMFLSALSVGYSPARALESANNTAAFACRSVGGRPSLEIVIAARKMREADLG